VPEIHGGSKFVLGGGSAEWSGEVLFESSSQVLVENGMLSLEGSHGACLLLGFPGYHTRESLHGFAKVTVESGGPLLSTIPNWAYLM